MTYIPPPQALVYDVAAAGFQDIVIRDTADDPANRIFLVTADVALHETGSETNGLLGQFRAALSKDADSNLNNLLGGDQSDLTLTGTGGSVGVSTSGTNIVLRVGGMSSGGNLQGRISVRILFADITNIPAGGG